MDELKYRRAVAIIHDLSKRKKPINLSNLYVRFQDTIYKSRAYCTKLIEKLSKKGLISTKNPVKIQFYEEKILKVLTNKSD